MQRKRGYLWVLALALMVGLVGCGQGNGNGNGEGDNGEPAGAFDRVEKETSEAIDAVGDWAEQTGERFTESARAQLDQLDARWDDLKGKLSEAANSEQARQVRDEINQKMAQAKEQLGEISEQAGEASDTARRRFATALKALSEKLDQAADHVDGSDEPSMPDDEGGAD